MGTVYAIANQKGGVGKTTTAVNLASCVAAEGEQTLLVDLDPQCNATVALGGEKDAASLLLRLPDRRRLGRRGGPARPDPTTSGWSRPAATSPAPRSSCRASRAPRRACASASARCASASPCTLLDCPPSLGPVSVNALVAADRVIVPVQAEYLALEGLVQFLETLGLIRRELNPSLEVSGLLITMHDERTRLAQDVEAELRAHFPGDGLRNRDPAQRPSRRVAELWSARDRARPLLARRRRLPGARQGARRPWLAAPSAASAAASRRSCRKRRAATRASCSSCRSA